MTKLVMCRRSSVATERFEARNLQGATTRHSSAMAKRRNRAPLATGEWSGPDASGLGPSDRSHDEDRTSTPRDNGTKCRSWQRDFGDTSLVSRWAVRTLALAVPLLAACGGHDASRDDGRLRVVTTVGMITFLAERIGEDRVRVDGLMGPGIDPHLYKASAGDVRTLAGAELILFNGLHLEAAMGDVLERMDGRTTTRAVTEAIPRERLLRPPEWEGAYDPHVWSDVRLWMYAAEAVADALVEADPAGEPEYRSRADALLAELEDLDEWVRRQVETVPEELRLLVTAHDAFNYFGQAYGFEVVGLQGLSTVTEAGTGDVQRVARLVAERRIPAVFIESSIPRRNIEAVQAAVRSRGFEVEVGGTLFSDAMGDPDTEEGTYPGMVRHNVRTIVEALGGHVEEDGPTGPDDLARAVTSPPDRGES